MSDQEGRQNDSSSPASDATAPLSEGTRLLDRFVVGPCLGRGPFGEVYAAVDPASEADYLLKRLPVDLMWGDYAMAIRALFRQVSTLDHPHIATTRFLEIAPRASELYTLSDRVQGPTLKAWLQQRTKAGESAALPHNLAVGLCEQIAEALDHAHTQAVPTQRRNRTSTGVLHRDLKPDNVILLPERPFRPGVPFAKVVDFGLDAEIAKAMGVLSAGGGKDLTDDRFFYRSPEQWSEGPLSPASDQWSLAVLFYELLAGTKPFHGGSLWELHAQIRSGKVEKPPQISDGQWVVLKKAFALKGQERYGNCLTMVRAFSMADMATTEMVVARPFVRMVSMRKPSGLQEKQGAVDERPLGPTDTPAASRGLRLFRRFALVTLLGIICGVLAWVLLYRNASPTMEQQKPSTETKPDQPHLPPTAPDSDSAENVSDTR